MASSLEKLLSNSSPSLSENEPALTDHLRIMAGSLGEDLLNMLRERNGFYALESALHVFPSHSSNQEIGLDAWNDDSL